MYRLTIYKNDKKIIDEFEDEDALREAVDGALNDVEGRVIKTFSVSWLVDKTHQKGFWEE